MPHPVDSGFQAECARALACDAVQRLNDHETTIALSACRDGVSLESFITLYGEEQGRRLQSKLWAGIATYTNARYGAYQST